MLAAGFFRLVPVRSARPELGDESFGAGGVSVSSERQL
jgi:hypothetical protein